MAAVQEPDPQIRGGGPGHPDPEKRGGGVVSKNYFRASVWSKNKGRHLDPPLGWY